MRDPVNAPSLVLRPRFEEVLYEDEHLREVRLQEIVVAGILHLPPLASQLLEALSEASDPALGHVLNGFLVEGAEHVLDHDQRAVHARVLARGLVDGCTPKVRILLDDHDLIGLLHEVARQGQLPDVLASLLLICDLLNVL